MHLLELVVLSRIHNSYKLRLADSICDVMRIGVFSDTHDNMVMIKRAIKVFNDMEVELVLHAGDFVSPFTIFEISNLRCRYVAVFGNNDGERFGLRDKILQSKGEIHDPPHEIDVAGKKFLLTHNPTFAELLAETGKFDVIVHGHNHNVETKRIEDTWIVNPGECGGWTTGKSTVVVFDLEKMEPQVIEL